MDGSNSVQSRGGLVKTKEYEMEEQVETETKTKRTYSVEEAATLLGVSRSAAYLAAQRGKLGVTVIRVGKRYLIPSAPLDRILSGNREESVAT